MSSPVKTKWSQSGHFYSLDHGSRTHEELPAGVYNIVQSKEAILLERRPSGFVLPEKIYGIEEAFIERVTRTFNQTQGNLGVMLNGIRGTGKTVTAELLAQKLGLPILLVCQDMPGLVDFMDSIPHAVTFLCDEFEKVFQHSGKDEPGLGGGQHERGASKLLPLMDGVMNSQHRKVFILTTNRLYVEPNLIQRPGRIRYLKTFGNLSRETIEMIVSDRLANQSSRREVIDYIARLELITIDIVTTLIEEMNIHGGSPEALDGLFNVKTLEKVFDVTRVDPETMEEDKPRIGCSVSPDELNDEAVGRDFCVSGCECGEIIAVKGEYVTVKRWNGSIEKDEERLYRVVPRKNYNADSFGKKYAGDAA